MKSSKFILFFGALVAILAVSCRSTKPVQAAPLPNTETKVITIKETLHDTVLVIKADTTTFAAQIIVDTITKIVTVTQPVKVKTNTVPGNLSPKKAILPKITVQPNNTLKIDVVCDSASIYYAYKTQDTTTETQITKFIQLPPEQVEKKLRWFQKFKMAMGGFLFWGLVIFCLGYGAFRYLKFIVKK